MEFVSISRSAPKLTTKQKRAAHIKSVVQKRYPKNSAATPSEVSVSPDSDVQLQPGSSSGPLLTPPHPKKLKLTSQQPKSSTPKPKVLPPPSDRVTRTRSRTN